MKSPENTEPLLLKNLRLAARIISIIFILGYSLIGAFALLMMNWPAPMSDYFFIVSGCVYVIGLLVGFKWELSGGLISLLFLIFVVINPLRLGAYDAINDRVMILSVPCILNFLSWHFNRKNSQNTKPK